MEVSFPCSQCSLNAPRKKNLKNHTDEIENKNQRTKEKTLLLKWINSLFACIPVLSSHCQKAIYIDGKSSLKELQGIGGIEVYLRHRIDCVGWDSLAWERDDLRGIVEHEPGSKQTKQCFHTESSRFCVIILRY